MEDMYKAASYIKTVPIFLPKYFIQQGQMMKWEDAHYTLDQDQLSDVFDLYLFP